MVVLGRCRGGLEGATVASGPTELISQSNGVFPEKGKSVVTYLDAMGAALPVSGAPTTRYKGASAPETLSGTSGNDELNAAGGDVLSGGPGDDTYYVWDGQETISERPGEGVDSVIGYGFGTTTLPAQVENLFLQGQRATTGVGNDLANILVAGNAGATLNGMGGGDVLVGGDGADIFQVVAGGGSDAISNFRSGHDLILLQGYAVNTLDQLKAIASQVGADVRLAFANGEALVIRDVNLGALTAYDFDLKPAPPALGAGYSLLSGAGSGATAGGWYVVNNTWGSGWLSYGVNYTVDTAYSPADLTARTTFSWWYPGNTQYAAPILAYPEVGFGPSPFNGGTQPTDVGAVLPVQVGELTRFTADYDVAYKGDLQGFDVAFDLWLTKTPGGDQSTISNEIMVWLHKGGVAPYGQLAGTTTINGVAADIYRAAGDWPYTAVILQADLPAGRLDVADLLSKMQALGIVSPAEYVASLQLGAEIISGSGALTVNNLDLDLATLAADGTRKTISVTGAGSTATLLGANGGVLGETLAGAAGADTLQGAADDDLLSGGRGADLLDGAAGSDTADYGERESTVRIALADGGDTIAYVRGVAEDTLRNIENLRGGAASDSLTGNAHDNQLTGGAGNDLLVGGGGDDSLIGGDGDDTLGDHGSTGASFIRGGSGDDLVYGGAGADYVNGNQGRDTIDGGSGGVDWLLGGQGDDLVTAHAGQVIINGNLGDDTVTGGRDDDMVRGGQGADLIQGGDGNDNLFGDRGNDTITGGAGADTFHFSAAGGHDRITDFNAGAGDRVQLDAGAAYSVSQVGPDTVVSLGPDDQLTLAAVQYSSLPAGWIGAA